MQAVLRVKYFVTQLGIRKEFAHRSASDVDVVIEDLVAQEKTLRGKKVGAAQDETKYLYEKRVLIAIKPRLYLEYPSTAPTCDAEGSCSYRYDVTIAIA